MRYRKAEGNTLWTLRQKNQLGPYSRSERTPTSERQADIGHSIYTYSTGQSKSFNS